MPCKFVYQMTNVWSDYELVMFRAKVGGFDACLFKFV